MAEIINIHYFNYDHLFPSKWYQCARTIVFFVKGMPFQFQVLQTDIDLRIWLCMETRLWRRENISFPPFTYSFNLIGQDSTVKKIGDKIEGALLPGETLLPAQTHLFGQNNLCRKNPDAVLSKQDLSPNFLPYGVLQIRCDLAFGMSKDQEEADPFQQIAREVHRFSDFTFKCEDQEFPANRLLLAARSPVFSAMFSENFQESKTGHTLIKDIDPKSLEALVKFCHTNNLDKDDLTTNLLVAANKYMIPGVIKKCEEHLSKTMSVDNAIDYFLTARLIEASKLRMDAKKFITKNLGEVKQTEDYKNIGKEVLEELLEYSCL